MVRRKPQKLCPYFHWYSRVMLLILRNFKVKVMPLLVFVIFCVLCSFLPLFIIYLVWVWQKSSKETKRKPGPSWYPPWKVIQFQPIQRHWLRTALSQAQDSFGRSELRLEARLLTQRGEKSKPNKSTDKGRLNAMEWRCPKHSGITEITWKARDGESVGEKGHWR